ncbi:MAG TPA: aldo/keto reductase [Caulobacteraceae bacterium]|jgi:D-threo-aldose 1-dehydrogenase|nr:aldo/keto reductase [Caulobacteraceae bacterium]
MFTSPQGRTLAFTPLGFGGAPLGNMHRVLAESEASATVRAAWDAGVRYFDTAPFYGHGLSEARIGAALAGEARDSFVLSTKVGRLLEPCASGEEDSGIYRATPPFRIRFDYSHDAVMRSFEESLSRLGVDRIDILYVHDLEPGHHTPAEAYEGRWRELTAGGGWRALEGLRASGAVAAIGLGVNEAVACERMLGEVDPDIFLLAGRYTLLEQAPLHGLLPACEQRGVGVVAGGPFNSGVLARPDGTFNYAAAPADVLARVARLRALCARFDTLLPAAALAFVAAHPAVISVIPGGQTPQEVTANAAMMARDIPAGLWAALKDEGLIDPAAPVPEPEPAAC